MLCLRMWDDPNCPLRHELDQRWVNGDTNKLAFGFVAPVARIN